MSGYTEHPAQTAFRQGVATIQRSGPPITSPRFERAGLTNVGSYLHRYITSHPLADVLQPGYFDDSWLTTSARVMVAAGIVRSGGPPGGRLIKAPIHADLAVISAEAGIVEVGLMTVIDTATPARRAAQ